MHSSSSYQYLPLKPSSQPDGEFRILTIHPGRKGSEIKATLQHVSFINPPPYEALSYTWGNPKGPENTVPVRGDPTETFQIQLGDKQKHIAYNLKEALEQLRDKTRPISMWIDALCIDQENPTEQSEQVKSMAKIYGQASRVIAWLGETDFYVNTASDTLEELFWATKIRILQYCAEKLKVPWFTVSDDAVATLIKAEVKSVMRRASPFLLLTTSEIQSSLQRALSAVSMDLSRSTDPLELTFEKFGSSGTLAKHLVSGNDNLSELPDFHVKVEALNEVFSNRSYWTRIWVIQEILNAASAVFVCGERHMDLDMMALVQLALSKVLPFSSYNLFTNGDVKSTAKFAESLTYLWRFHHEQNYCLKSRRGETLARNLVIFSGRSCSNARDRIYSLVNISKPIDITIDYNKSVTDIWIDATRSIITQERSLNIICALDHSLVTAVGEKVEGLPSWVPQYGMYTLGTGGLCSLDRPNDRQFYKGCGALTNPNNSHVTNKRILPIRGRSSGNIKVIWAQLSPANWPADELSAILALMRDGISIAHADSHALWRALVLDYYRDNSNASQRIGRLDEAGANLAADIEDSLAGKPPPSRLVERFEATLNSKWLCMTSDERIALVLGEPRVGDQVFFARGATCPFVLRPTAEDGAYEGIKRELEIETFHTFVGSAYVHERMDGEPLQEAESEGTEEEAVFLI